MGEITLSLLQAEQSRLSQPLHGISWIYEASVWTTLWSAQVPLNGTQPSPVFTDVITKPVPMKGEGGNFDRSTGGSTCHSSFLHLFQGSGIETRVHGDCICILASFLMDIASVAGTVLLSARLHMATRECGSSALHLLLTWQQLSRLWSAEPFKSAKAAIQLAMWNILTAVPSSPKEETVGQRECPVATIWTLIRWTGTFIQQPNSFLLRKPENHVACGFFPPLKNQQL